MIRKELKSNLLKKLASILANYGFEKKIYGQSLRKKINSGLAEVHLTFIDHQDDFDITLDIGIRIDELEDLINQNNKLLTEKEKRGTFTLGVEIGNLIEGEPKRWTIHKEDDIEPTIESMIQSIKNIVLPYIDKYSDMEQVLDVSIKDDEYACLHMPLDYRRAMNAVGLAKILGNTVLLDNIIQNKLDYLQKKEDFGQSIFISFVEQISSYL